jgi:hypothetical protein
LTITVRVPALGWGVSRHEGSVSGRKFNELAQYGVPLLVAQNARGLAFCQNSQIKLTKTIVIDIVFASFANTATSALALSALNLEDGHD